MGVFAIARSKNLQSLDDFTREMTESQKNMARLIGYLDRDTLSNVERTVTREVLQNSAALTLWYYAMTLAKEAGADIDTQMRASTRKELDRLEPLVLEDWRTIGGGTEKSFNTEAEYKQAVKVLELLGMGHEARIEVPASTDLKIRISDPESLMQMKNLIDRELGRGI